MKIVGTKNGKKGKEEDYVFSKATCKLIDTSIPIIEEFQGGEHGRTYKIYFKEAYTLIDEMPEYPTIKKGLTNKYLSLKTKAVTEHENYLSYRLDFISKDNKCQYFYNQSNHEYIVECEPNGIGHLEITLQTNSYNYFSDGNTYSTNTRLYLVTKEDNKPAGIELDKDIYVFVKGTGAGNNITYSAKCWTEEDVDDSQNFKSSSSDNLTAELKTLYVEQHLDVSKPLAEEKTYINVYGTCDNHNINTMYEYNPATDYNALTSNTEPRSTTEFNQSNTNKYKQKYDKYKHFPNISNNNSSALYLVLESIDDINNLNINARCYLPEDRFMLPNYNSTSYYKNEYFYDKLPREIDNLTAKIYMKKIVNADNQEVNVQYGQIRGMCGETEINAEYPISEFSGINYSDEKKDIFNNIVEYVTEAPHQLDGVVRNNLYVQ